MAALLKNVLFDVSRSVLDAKGNTSIPQPYATSIPAHIQPVSANQMGVLMQQGLTAQFVTTVDWGTDVAEGDILHNIVLLSDRKTPWPGNLPLAEVGDVPAATVVWRVVWVQPSTPGPLDHTNLFLTRTVGSGPTSHMG